MKRRAVREMALKVLFAYEMGKNDPYSILEILWEEEPTDQGARNFCKYIVEGVIGKQDEIDDILKKYAIEWDLERMAAVDRNIMRMALFEMLYSREIPRAVAVNEAIELGKKYGGEESARFINGILGNVTKSLPLTEGERGK